MLNSIHKNKELLENPFKFTEHLTDLLGNPFQNQQKLDPYRPQIDESAPLGRFGPQIAPRSPPGRSGSYRALDFWNLFGAKWRSKGPLTHQNGSKMFLGTLSVTKCSQVGSKTVPVVRCSHFFEAFVAKNVASRVASDSSLGPKMALRSHF